MRTAMAWSWLVGHPLPKPSTLEAAGLGDSVARTCSFLSVQRRL